MMSGRILVFAKAPLPGLAKSRLIPTLGADRAADLQAHFIRHTLATTARLQLPTELLCAPDIEHPAFGAAARDFSVQLYTQKGGDLGARMSHAIECGIARGGPVVLIGTDCPALAAGDLHDAFDALCRGHDAVLGPAADGGYYLIGLNGPGPQLFSEIQWSTPNVLNETRARLRSTNMHWHELRQLRDIDTPADLADLPDTLKKAISYELA